MNEYAYTYIHIDLYMTNRKDGLLPWKGKTTP